MEDYHSGPHDVQRPEKGAPGQGGSSGWCRDLSGVLSVELTGLRRSQETWQGRKLSP